MFCRPLPSLFARARQFCALGFGAFGLSHPPEEQRLRPNDTQTTKMQAHTGVCRSVCVRACELCLCGAAVRHSAHVSPGREASWHTNAAKLLRHHDRKRKLRFRAGCPAKGVAQAARLTQHRPQRKLLSHPSGTPPSQKKKRVNYSAFVRCRGRRSHHPPVSRRSWQRPEC